MNKNYTSESLSLERNENEYVLAGENQSGLRTEIILTEANVLFLRKLLLREIPKIAARRSSQTMNAQGVLPTIAFPVSSVRLAPDLHQEDALMTTIDQCGDEITFALPLAILRSLRDHLPSLVAEMESNLLSQTKQ